MIRLKNEEDVALLRESGRRLSVILAKVAKKVVSGVTTSELDDYAGELIKEGGDKPAFLNYRPEGSRLSYPATLCVSINEEIVHGIPKKRQIKNGDIVTIDLGLSHQGRFTDMAKTIAVGNIDDQAKKLISITRESLDLGIKQAVPGNYVGDIGFAVAEHVKKNGFGLIRDLCGHGVGFAPHEDPLVPNFGKKGSGAKLEPGLVIAIEPMVALGGESVKLLDDGFTFITGDGSISAHFEHTVLITKDKPEVLTK